MKERLLKFLEEESLTAAKFADEIGVQRSSISHLLSGRNNPGYDFFQKVLKRYPQLNAEWLLMGSGKMTKAAQQGSLFTIGNEADKDNNENSLLTEEAVITKPVNKEPAFSIENPRNIATDNKESVTQKEIDKIVILYADQSFTIYKPSKR